PTASVQSKEVPVRSDIQEKVNIGPLIVLTPTFRPAPQLVGWRPGTQATVQMGSLHAGEEYGRSVLGEYSIIGRALEWKLRM
ncbi:hypothetical protein Ac2012v2_005390, partial [Leucoagaricus gongylophorus]